jgi:predicted transcriptional regulator
MNNKQKHLEDIEQLQKVIETDTSIEDMKKHLILEKIEEWKHEEEAMSIIPNKLLELYKEDIEPLFLELGLI